MIPKIKNKTLLIIIGVSVVAILSGLILLLISPQNDLSLMLIDSGMLISLLFGLILLIRNGSITSTNYWRILKFCISIALVGSILLILHIAGARILLSVSFLAMAITYSVRFFNKLHKNHLDILKFLWFITAMISAILIILKLIPTQLNLIPYGLFWLTIMVFIVQGVQSKKLFEK